MWVGPHTHSRSPPVAVSRPCQQDQAAKRSNRRESPSSVWSRHSGAAWRVLTKLRVNLGLTIATMADWHHGKDVCAVIGHLRAPVVITTTVHANADELQVSTTVEANTGDASASGCRSGTTPPTIASNVAKPQSAPVKSWIDRTSTWPTAAGLRWALGRGRTVAVGRTSVVWLCGLDD